MRLLRRNGSCPTRSQQTSAGEVCRVFDVAMGGEGPIVGCRLSGTFLLCQQGTIGAALELVVFLLSEASGRGQWRTRGNLTAKNLIDSCT